MRKSYKNIVNDAKRSEYVEYISSCNVKTMEMKTSAFNDSSHFTFNWNIAKKSCRYTGIDIDDESGGIVFWTVKSFEYLKTYWVEVMQMVYWNGQVDLSLMYEWLLVDLWRELGTLIKGFFEICCNSLNFKNDENFSRILQSIFWR